MKRIATTAAAAGTLLAIAPAGAPAASKDLWATVNVCDTKKHPNEMGVRARMPGDGNRERMYMRFTAQFRKGTAWKTVEGKGVSKWLYAGSALFRNEELGYTFSFDSPAEGHSYLMRGRVEFQWRRKRHGHWRVVHHTRKLTEGGHRSSGADPKGYSAARCRIEG